MLRLPDWYVPLAERVLGHAPDDDPALRAAEPLLQQLSAYFTAPASRAPGAASYLSDTRVRNAYFLYYTTANLLKPLHPLDELFRGRLTQTAEELSVLDLGCGTATGLLALAAWSDRVQHTSAFVPPRMHYTGADRDRGALEFTRRTADALGAISGAGPASVTTHLIDLARLPEPERRHDLILAMNVLNELPADRPERALAWMEQSLADGGSVVIIEPALRETSRRLLALREHAVRSGWTIHAPCFRQGNCPALTLERDWCHHDMEWERPAWIARLDRALGNVKLSLKFSYLVLNRSGRTLADAFVERNAYQRVVSEVFLEKGRTLMYLCGEEGRRLYQRNRRDISYENAVVDDLARFDVVALDNAIERTHDVLITQDTVVIKA